MMGREKLFRKRDARVRKRDALPPALEAGYRENLNLVQFVAKTR